MPLPFAFEPRPVDQIMPGRREAHDTSTCWQCSQPVDYANLEEIDQAEYRISYVCPECFRQMNELADELDKEIPDWRNQP